MKCDLRLFPEHANFMFIRQTIRSDIVRNDVFANRENNGLDFENTSKKVNKTHGDKKVSIRHKRVKNIDKKKVQNPLLYRLYV